MKNFFQNRTVDTRLSIGFLIMRLVMGLAMSLHGLPKIQNPMAWAGDGFPSFLQLLAAISEFGGGIALIVGLLVPLASLGIVCTMAVAVHMHAIVKGDPFVGHEGSYELASIYLCFAVLMILAGPGKYSLDQKLFSQSPSTP